MTFLHPYNQGVIAALEVFDNTVSQIVCGELKLPEQAEMQKMQNFISNETKRSKQAALANQVKQLRLRAPDMRKGEYRQLLNKVTKDEPSEVVYGNINL